MADIQDALMNQEMQMLRSAVAAPGRAAMNTANAVKTGYKLFCFLHKHLPKSSDDLLNGQPIGGQQSIEELCGSGAKLESIEISDKNIADFESTAKDFGVHFALHKITVPGENGEDDKTMYAVFFKASQAEVLQSAMSEYARRVELKANSNSKPSVLEPVLSEKNAQAEQLNAARAIAPSLEKPLENAISGELELP